MWQDSEVVNVQLERSSHVLSTLTPSFPVFCMVRGYTLLCGWVDLNFIWPHAIGRGRPRAASRLKLEADTHLHLWVPL